MGPALDRVFEAARHAQGMRLAGLRLETIAGLVRAGVRALAAHTGVPALLVGAIAVVAGYRLLKRTARFALQVAFVAAVLFAATELGWICW